MKMQLTSTKTLHIAHMILCQQFVCKRFFMLIGVAKDVRQISVIAHLIKTTTVFCYNHEYFKY